MNLDFLESANGYLVIPANKEIVEQLKNCYKRNNDDE